MLKKLTMILDGNLVLNQKIEMRQQSLLNQTANAELHYSIGAGGLTSLENEDLKGPTGIYSLLS